MGDVDPDWRGDQNGGNTAVDVQIGREQIYSGSNTGAITGDVEGGGDDGVDVFWRASGRRHGRRVLK